MAPADIRTRIEQLRRSKNRNGPKKPNTNTNVKDLRQLIAKKSRPKAGDDRSPHGIARGRVTKQDRTSIQGSSTSRDLRDTNRRLASRKSASQTRDRPSSRNDRISSRSIQSARPATVVKTRTVSNGQPVRIGKKVIQQQQYYIPPHMQRNQPTYIIAPPAPSKSHMNMNQVHEHHHQQPGGASILISNLTPPITQSDIIELFGDIGVMTAVNIINPTTALVTYQNSSDAVRAVKVYHNRPFDGRPLLVNMMPSTV